MKSDESLKETIIHGTPKMPIKGMHCTAGEGTPYPVPFFVDRHWHHKTEIVSIIRGTYEFEINLENYILQEGDICFLNSEDLHKISGRGKTMIHDVILFDSRILNFSYEDDFEENVIGPFVAKEKSFPHVITPKAPDYQIISQMIQELMAQSINQKKGWYCSCKLLLLKLIYYMEENQLLLSSNKILSATDKQKISRYKEITSYIEKNYAEPITLQQLADIIPCNSQYLCRFFKEITGITPIQYLIQRRVEHACEMLKETTKSVLEISLDCGFENVSYFIRQFKKLKGCTPKEYRKDS
ncbi:MAG: helix-turn-helix transcriptional regulator [Lachnospiraceae bacterium]|nr:helix-turn-helix transcriptional regulator [Lachnospiraceae bacterium]